MLSRAAQRLPAAYPVEGCRPQRRRLAATLIVRDPRRAALVISWVSICCSALTGVSAVAIGLTANSLALVGAGASVLLDLASSVVLVRRFRHPHAPEAAERRAQQVAAFALLLLGLLLAGSGAYRLAGSGGQPHPTTAALSVAAASVVVLPLVASRKYFVAPRVPSRALVTDAHITVVGATTALLTLAGLALTRQGLPAADAVAAVLIACAAMVVGLLELKAARIR